MLTQSKVRPVTQRSPGKLGQVKPLFSHTLAIALLVSMVSGGALAQPGRLGSAGPSGPQKPSGLSLGLPLPRVASAGKGEPADVLPPGWANARLLAEKREPASGGAVLRVRVLSGADSHYPARFEEWLEPGPAGREWVTRRLETAADHLLVRPKKGVRPERLLAVMRPVGASAAQRLGPHGLLRLDLAELAPEALPQALAGLAAAADLVEYAEPDYLVRISSTEPNDPAYLAGQLWGLRTMSAATAWDTRNDASSVLVAVVDTGIRATHEDLSANMWINTNEVAGDMLDNDHNGVVDDVFGYNAIANSGNPDDDNGHGTHVSGTIGGRGNNALGVAGVAWRVRLMAVKFLSANGSGFISDAVLGIDYARQMGARIMNNSWGGADYSQALVDAIERTRQAGIIFVAAAGNDAVLLDSAASYPAAYAHDNIVSVAATTSADGLAAFSNWGLRTVDIAAPGSGIYSTWYSANGAYTTLSGTSMAAPHVSGAFALLRAQFPGATYSDLITRLLATADHPAGLALRVRSQGRVNLARALTASTVAPLPSILQQPQGANVLAGGSANLAVLAAGGEPLSYQWRRNGFDLPGATASSLALTGLQSTNTGRFSVLVANPSGLALSEDAVVSVNQPVSITAQPQGATLLIDETFSTAVTAAGDPPLGYQWRKNGTDIPGETSPALKVYGVTTRDAGTYTVRVANSVSSLVSSAAVLSVLAPPVITAAPQDQVAAAKGSASFSVAAEGSPTLGYQWFKDGAALSGKTTPVLSLSAVTLSSAGAYWVRITNSVGAAWACASLTVKASSTATGYPQFTLHPSDQVVNAAATAVFTGAATPAGVAYQWRKDGTNLPGATSTTLTVNPAGAADVGLYSLAANNSFGAAASHGARLILRQGPAITRQPQSVSALPGTQVVLEVGASGTEPLAYQWRKDGQVIGGATGRRLFIAGVGAGDTGTYVVTVSNPAGSVTSLPATVGLLTSALTTWRQIEPAMYWQINFCAAGAPDGLYVAGYDGGINWSPDEGQTWCRRPRAVGVGRSIYGLAYAAGRYVAIGYDNNTQFSLTSSDGITWSRHPASLPSSFVSPLRFDGTSFYTALAYNLAFSPDGITWSLGSFGGGPFRDVCYGNGRYVAVGDYGAIRTSTNRTSWTSSPSGTSEHLLAVCYGSAGFIAVGNHGAMLVSSNGLDWRVLPTVTSQRLNGIGFGNGRYVVAGGSSFNGSVQPAVTLVSDDGLNWRRTSNPSRFNLTGVSFANGLFVAYGCALLTSSDGEHWEARGPANSDRLYGIAYGNGVFVAVGNNGVIRNSRDGLNWIIQRGGQSQDFWTVGFGCGQFVAGTLDGALYTSPDAVNWQRLPMGAGLIDCVRSLNGRLFALTQSGEILISSDAVNWSRASLVTGAPLTHIAWDGSQYLVCGYDGTILTSPDGNACALRSTPTRLHLGGIAYGGGRYVAVGDQGVVLTSNDAVSWTAGTSGQSNFLHSVTYGMGLFVAVGSQGVILTSPNGVAWTQTSSGTTTSFDQVEVFNGRFVATGGGYVAYSVNGANWTWSQPEILTDLAYGNGLYAGVGFDGRLRTSTDLSYWPKGSFDPQGYGTLSDVKFDGARFIACNRSGNVFLSTNGQNWSVQSTGFNGPLEQLACGAGRCVAVGGSGAVLCSSNGVQWSLTYVPGVSYWDSVAFGGGQFVAGGYRSALATSPDGITWTKRTVTPSTIQGVAYGNSTYVAVGSSGEILSSPNGANWAIQTNAGITLQAVGFSNGKFVAAGDLGAMFTSTDGAIWSPGERDASPYVFGLLDLQGATLAVGDAGTISVSASSPSILTQPLSQRVRIGSPVTLSVAAEGPGVLQYQWYEDGQPLAGATAASLSWTRIASANAGEYFVRVTSLAGSLDSIHAFLDVTRQPFDAWLISYFGEANFLDPSQESTLWGPQADPDHDGLSNLAEYTYGLSPLAPASGPALEPSIVAGRLRVTFTRRTNDPALQVAPRVSCDLSNWHSGPGYVQELEVVPISSELERVTVQDMEPLPPAASRFLQLLLQFTGP